MTNAKLPGSKNGKPIENTFESHTADLGPYTLTTLETENTPTDDLLLASTSEIEKFTVKNSLLRNWTKNDIPIAQQEKIEFKNK